jgi:2-amino-4-hydroxy-6-hydroxymethyldihydropteridine diphosphokinase
MGGNASTGMEMTANGIFIGLGANLPSRFGPPEATLAAALARLEALGVRVAARSRWYETAPVPVSDQPWYVNGIARVETTLPPAELLAILHRIEGEFGRVRAERNAPRLVDLDLLAYDQRVIEEPDLPVLPHPRMHERAFVLLPLRELAPAWRHPRLSRSLDALIADLPREQVARPRGSA